MPKPKAITKIPKIKKGRGKGKGVNIKNNYQKVNLVVHTGEKDKPIKKGFVPPYHILGNTTSYIPPPINNSVPLSQTSQPLENAITELLKNFSSKSVPVQTTNSTPIISEEEKEKRKPTKMKVPLLISTDLKEKAVKNPIVQALSGEETSSPPKLDNIPFIPNILMEAIRRRGRPPDSEEVKQMKQDEKRQMKELKKKTLNYIKV